MKKFCLALALASGFLVSKSPAISLDDIQLWTGSGTNRAGLIIEWSAPRDLSTTSVPAPIADKTLVWGYRFNGSANGLDMLHAIENSDRRLYMAELYGGAVMGAIGYNLKGDGNIGITDGSNTDYFTNGFQPNPTADLDLARPLNSNDLYWGGFDGPNWELWTESGDLGGFLVSPNRGTNAYWTPEDTNNPYFGSHGQWDYADNAINGLTLTNGSWLGYSVAAGGDIYTNDSAPTTIAYNFDKHAPPSPEGTYVAYVANTNDFGAQVLSASNLDTSAPYNDPAAMLGRPALKFLDSGELLGQLYPLHRTKIIEAAYATDANSNAVDTEILANGQVTLNMGRKIYDDPNHLYGIDLIVYAYSFMSATGFHGQVDDFTDMNVAKLGTGLIGHPTVVSVSQDGTNWYTYPQVNSIFAQDSYRWDETNHIWTDEEMNPTKPINPEITSLALGGETVALALDRFVGGTGGTGYDLKASGYPWIQYVRIAASTTAGLYAVIDAVAAVNPTVVGDAISISPSNLLAGISNVVFQKPSDPAQTQIALRVDSVSGLAKISTVSLSEFSSYGPVVGNVSSAYQLTLRGITNTSVSCTADVSLRAGDCYAGDGSDLRVYQWGGTNWSSQPFVFNSASKLATVAGVTNFSAFVVAQIAPPQLSAQPQVQSGTNGFAFQFAPVMNVTTELQRSVDLKTWMTVASITPTNSQSVTLQDFTPPADKAFYRLHLIVP